MFVVLYKFSGKLCQAFKSNGIIMLIVFKSFKCITVYYFKRKRWGAFHFRMKKRAGIMLVKVVTQSVRTFSLSISAVFVWLPSVSLPSRLPYLSSFSLRLLSRRTVSEKAHTITHVCMFTWMIVSYNMNCCHDFMFAHMTCDHHRHKL